METSERRRHPMTRWNTGREDRHVPVKTYQMYACAKVFRMTLGIVKTMC